MDGDYILGIKTNEKIIKQNINLKDNMYSFVISDKFDFNSQMGCVLLKQNQRDITPILWGNERNSNYKNSIVNSLRESINKLSLKTTRQETTPTKVQETVLQKQLEPTLDVDTQILTNNFFPETIEETNYNTYSETENLDQNTIEQMQLKENVTESKIRTTYHNNAEILAHLSQDNFMSDIAIAGTQASLFESDEQEVEQLIDNELQFVEKGKHKFYDMIADQLEEIFDRYPKETNLSTLIEDSVWAKIDTDSDKKHYVVGIITSNGDIKYICYGVPGNYNVEPPVEMRDYSQWLPTDVKNPYNNGYWVMYQDADTGENVYIN